MDADDIFKLAILFHRLQWVKQAYNIQNTCMSNFVQPYGVAIHLNSMFQDD